MYMNFIIVIKTRAECAASVAWALKNYEEDVLHLMLAILDSAPISGIVYSKKSVNEYVLN